MILERLITQLKSDEGFRSRPYRDSVGVFTIGYGTTHVNGYKVNKDWRPVDKQMAERWLFYNLPDAISQAKRFAINFDGLNHEKQEALVNMAYQLGSRQSQFIKARKALNNAIWSEVYKQFLDSKWARQTPNRAKRIAKAFIS